MWALPVPQIQPKGKCHGTKQNEQPPRRPVLHHYLRVRTFRKEVADANVNAVGDKTKASKEPQQIDPR